MAGAQAELDLVFVYGTLRRGEVHHDVLLDAGARFVGLGRITGRLWDLGAYPGVVRAEGAEREAGPEGREEVRGELYRLADPRAALAVLDELEGHDPARPEGSLFVRREVEVRGEGGGRIAAWAWFLPREPRGATPIPGGDYGERGRRQGPR